MGNEQGYHELEKELELTKKQLRFFSSVLDQSTEGLSVANLEGHLIFVNSAFATMHGYTPEELVGKHLSIFHTPDQMLSVEAANCQIRDRCEFKGEMWHVRRNGTVFPTMIHNSLFRDDAGNPIGLIGTIRDITEHKQAEEALRENEEKYRTLFDMESDALALIEIETGNILDVNKAFVELYGYSKEEILWMKNTDFSAEPELTKEATLARLTYVPVRYHKKRDGTVFPTEITASVFKYQGRDVYIAAIRDITERKRLEDQFFQAQKMESVGRLAGGVAHDFSNMLTVILGYTELALKKVLPENPIHADLQEVLKTAKRSVAVTRQLLAFARRQTIEPEVLNLNETLEEMLKMLRRLIGEDIELIWSPKNGLWSIYGDPSQIDQLLANLCVNARDAISGVGKITIETQNVILDEAFSTAYAGFMPSEYVMLAVSDNGCGMEKETLDKVFEPFFTTKEPGKGTGLGLSTVYGIVKQHQGFINVYSEPGKGTSFKIYLPRHWEDTETNLEDSADKIPQGHGETILIVEDEVLVLEVGKKILSNLGYHVLTAGTPDKAMKMIREYPDEIHLLLTDVVLPKMNGKELAEQVTEIRPNMKVLFMSGYTAEAISNHEILYKDAPFIQKPLIIANLARKVRRVLGILKNGLNAQS